jgi:hypothetical protein
MNPLNLQQLSMLSFMRMPGKGARWASEIDTTGRDGNSWYKGTKSGTSSRPWSVVTVGIGWRTASGKCTWSR